jgi:riboflavin kinase / FMN adenylyltransferase
MTRLGQDGSGRPARRDRRTSPDIAGPCRCSRLYRPADDCKALFAMLRQTLTLDHLSQPDDTLQGMVVALGNFDGVHAGHRAVIAAAQAQAAVLGTRSAVLTFEPHPRTLFRPDDPPFRLTPWQDKARLIAAIGIDALLTMPFDRKLSGLSADIFIRTVLIGALRARHVVTGMDFRFGMGRVGDATLLRQVGAAAGFGVTEVGPVADAAGVAISSTRIRNHLQAGEPEPAAALLGHLFTIGAIVAHGDQRGRTIGVPTANLPLGDFLRPRFGVYAVTAGIGENPDRWIQAVANIGRRPTVGGTVERLEVHLFDFSGDLYGQTLQVRLHRFLRPEQSFDSFAALTAQIRLDLQAARAALAEPFADPSAGLPGQTAVDL